jgi:hypothetical protein
VVVVDRRTKQDVTLVLGKLANSPESYAILSYLWTDPREKTPKGAQEIRVKQNMVFQLPPDQKSYKVAAIEKDHVDIILPSGETYTVSATLLQGSSWLSSSYRHRVTFSRKKSLRPRRRRNRLRPRS